MKRTIYKDDFRDAFHRMGRGNQFSYEALGAMYDWITEFEEDSEHEIELDVIALCCEFTEYETEAEALDDYSLESMDELGARTLVIPFDGGLLVQNF